MANQTADLGRFSESGRGLPVTLSRPQGALPYSPVTRQAYAAHPTGRLGWAQGVIAVADVPLEPARALAPSDSLATAARRMLDDEAGFVPVCVDGRLVGVVYVDAVLLSVADNRKVPSVAQVLSPQIPTCTPASELVDAVRQMIACYLRKIPVVGDAGELRGLLTLSEASAAAASDPSVAELIERFAASPSLFARRLR
jgi:CBS domain-containing protein